jgi:hypothetical protein
VDQDKITFFENKLISLSSYEQTKKKAQIINKKITALVKLTTCRKKLVVVKMRDRYGGVHTPEIITNVRTSNH